MDNFVLEVYGESEYTLLALKSVAAIFSFNDFLGLVYVFIVIGLFCAMIQFLYKVHTGFASVHLLILHFIGATILITLCIVPKSTVTVHDMIKNRFTEVYRVPTILSFIAWAANDIENGLKDIVIGATGPINDPTIVGRGEGLELLAQMEKIPQIYHVQNKELSNSMSRYMVDCASLEISLGKIAVDSLSTTNNLWEEFRSENQAAFTEIRPKVSATCKAAYTEITTLLTAEAGNAATTYCNGHDYEAHNVFKCKNDMEFIVNTFVVGASGQTTAQDAIINMFVADAYTHAMAMLSEQDPQSYGANSAYFKTVGGQYQSSIAAMKWLPAMIGMYRAMLLAIFPLCVLLVFVAPKKTTMWYLGGFTALVLWSVIDTILLSYFLTRLTQTFAEVQSTGLGVQQLLSMPSKAMQILTQFGSARWGGMGLATAMTVGILGLTGHAMSNIAQSSAGSADSTARSEGGKFAGSAGSATAYQEGLKAQTAMREVEGLRAIPQMQLADWAAGHNVQNTVSSGVMGQMRSENYGGNVAAGTSAGQTGFTNSMIGDSKASAIGSNAAAVGDTMGKEANANAFGRAAQAQALYGDASRTQDVLNNQKANNGKIVADDEIAKNLSAFGVKAGDNLDMQIGKDGNITRLGVSGTRDGKDYQKTIGGDGLVATDLESWKKGNDFRTVDVDSYNYDHSWSKDTSKTTDSSVTIDSSYTNDSSKTTDSSVTYDSSFTDDSSYTKNSSRRTDSSVTVDDSNNRNEGNNYRGALQGALERDSLAVKDWNGAVNEYREAETFLKLSESGLIHATNEDKEHWAKMYASAKERHQEAQEQLTTKEIALTTALTNDMNQIRRASDSSSEFESQTDSVGVYGKAEVRANTPRALPIGGSISAGVDGRMSWQDGDKQESSVSYDKTYQEVAGMLKDARSRGDAEQNAYDSINSYYNGVIDLAPSDTGQPKPDETSQDSTPKDDEPSYNNRGGRHKG
jgi:hypothetical protein